jgi:uncharacterized protein (DUF58 family)
MQELPNLFWMRLMFRDTQWPTTLLRRVVPNQKGIATIGARAIYILPTGFGFAYSVLLFITLLGALNYQNNLGLLFTFLMASMALVSMHHTWFNLLGLQINIRGGAPVFNGQRAQFTLIVTDTQQRHRYGLKIRDSEQCQSIPFGARATFHLTRPTQQRGWLTVGEIIIETRYPLGLFRAWSILNSPCQVLVYPTPADQAKLPYCTDTPDHQGYGGQGVGAEDYVGPRHYQPGDSLRRVDWKALARQRGLIVKQFGGDRALRLWLDWSLFSNIESERRLSLLCRQVIEATAQDLTYGLRLPGQVIKQNHGDVHKHACLAALALERSI